MRNFSRDWLAVALTSVAITTAITILIVFWADGSCTGAARLTLKKIWAAQNSGINSLGCTEIWFNRNQTFIGNLAGGVLALIAAFLAGFFALRAAENAAAPVKQQLDEVRRNNAIAVLSSYKAELAALYQEKNIADAIAMQWIYFGDTIDEICKFDTSNYSSQFNSLESHVNGVKTYIRQYEDIIFNSPLPDGDDGARLRFKYIAGALVEIDKMMQPARKWTINEYGLPIIIDESKKIAEQAATYYRKISLDLDAAHSRINKISAERRQILKRGILDAKQTFSTPT